MYVLGSRKHVMIMCVSSSIVPSCVHFLVYQIGKEKDWPLEVGRGRHGTWKQNCPENVQNRPSARWPRKIGQNLGPEMCRGARWPTKSEQKKPRCPNANKIGQKCDQVASKIGPNKCAENMPRCQMATPKMCPIPDASILVRNPRP